MSNRRIAKYVPHHYTPILKKWREGAGPVPSTRILQLVDQSGYVKPGSKDALALAMTLRPYGATQAQITIALGQPHRNKIKELVQSGKAHPVPVTLPICKLELKIKSK